MRVRAESRQLSDLTIGPVLTWTTEAMLDHMNKLLQVPGKQHTLQCLLRCLLSARWGGGAPLTKMPRAKMIIEQGCMACVRRVAERTGCVV